MTGEGSCIDDSSLRLGRAFSVPCLSFACCWSLVSPATSCREWLDCYVLSWENYEAAWTVNVYFSQGNCKMLCVARPRCLALNRWGCPRTVAADTTLMWKVSWSKSGVGKHPLGLLYSSSQPGRTLIWVTSVTVNVYCYSVTRLWCPLWMRQSCRNPVPTQREQRVSSVVV